MDKFPDNHYVEILQGARRPHPAKVRKCLARRAAYLAKKAEKILKTSGRCSFYDYLVDELESLVEVMECYEAAHPGKEKAQCPAS